MIRHMRHGSPPRLKAFQSIPSPNRRESLPTPSAGVRMTSPRLRAPHWAFVLGFAGVVSIPPTGAAQAQFFDPFSQFFAPQAPTYAPQAPVYAPPVVYRRTPRVSRRTQPVLTSVPDRPHVRRSRVPERVRHVSVPRPTPVRIHLASLPDPAPVPKHKSSEPPAAKESVREEAEAA